MNQKESQNIDAVPPEWRRLMRVAERIGYGEARVIFKNGKPNRIDNAIQQIKLDSEEDFRTGLETIPLI